MSIFVIPIKLNSVIALVSVEELVSDSPSVKISYRMIHHHFAESSPRRVPPVGETPPGELPSRRVVPGDSPLLPLENFPGGSPPEVVFHSLLE